MTGTEDTHRRRFLRPLGAVAIVAVAAALVVIDRSTTAEDPAGAAPTACADFRFDARAWAAWSDRRQPRPQVSRMAQAERIAACETFVGLPRSRVIDLLGAPDESSGGKQYWMIGVDPDFGVQTKYLVASYDSDARVHRVEVL